MVASDLVLILCGMYTGAAFGASLLYAHYRWVERRRQRGDSQAGEFFLAPARKFFRTDDADIFRTGRTAGMFTAVSCAVASVALLILLLVLRAAEQGA